MNRIILLSLCAGAQLFAGQAMAATLLASDQAGNLSSVDTLTGAGTLIGQETGFPLATEIEYDTTNGILYGDETNGNTNLHTIDPLTGLSTGSVPHACCAYNGMEFVGDVLYVTNITGSGGPSTLEIIDPTTGANTPVGPTGFGPISGLAHDPNSGTTYGVTAGGQPAQLLTVNLATGVATAVAPLLDASGAPLVAVGSIEFGDDGVLYGGMGLNGSPNAGWLFSIDVSTGLSTFIGATGLAGITGLTSAEAIDVVDGTARFQVGKTFTNGDTGDVEVTLTCNGGIPLQQSFTISGGGPGVTFTVTNLPDTGANCEVTESGGNEGYTADLSACSWTGVTGGIYTCPIENVPEPTEVTVETTIDTEGEATIDPTFTTTIVCENVSPDTGPVFGTVTVEDTSGLFEADWYADPVNGTDCTVTMVPNDMAVEGSSCSFSFAIGDEEAGCDVAGTVFFEGIPTLSQYGLALLALLMLGIGLVGFRRFV